MSSPLKFFALLIYKQTNEAYKIRPKAGDCLTTFNDGFLKLDDCNDTLYQNFEIDCRKKDPDGNLSECFIVNQATEKPIGTDWNKSDHPNYEHTDYIPNNARWWSFVVQEAYPK